MKTQKNDEGTLLKSTALLALHAVLVIGGVTLAENFRGQPLYWAGFVSVAIGSILGFLNIKHFKG